MTKKEFIFSTGSSTYKEWLKNEYERIDKVTNSIYQGIASIKYLNAKISKELYDLAQNNTYNSFIDLLKINYISPTKSYSVASIILTISISPGTTCLSVLILTTPSISGASY